MTIFRGALQFSFTKCGADKAATQIFNAFPGENDAKHRV